MSINESLERALEQARDVQQSIIDAFSKTADQMKPQVESSLHAARDLQVTLIKHVEAEGALAAKSATEALSHLEDYLALGANALQESSQQMRILAKKMIQQSVKVVDAAASATTSRLPDDAAEPSTKGE